MSENTERSFPEGPSSYSATPILTAGKSKLSAGPSKEICGVGAAAAVGSGAVIADPAPRQAASARGLTGNMFATSLQHDRHGIDAIGIERHVLFDVEHRVIGLLIAPYGIDGFHATHRNAEVGTLALIGTIRQV